MRILWMASGRGIANDEFSNDEQGTMILAAKVLKL
jgi:hypothetical protein